MWKEFLERLRTPECRLLGPNVWFIKKFGFRLRQSALGKVLCIFFHQCMGLHVMTQFVDLYLKRDDTEAMIKGLNTALITFLCFSKGCTMQYWQREWEDAINYVTEVDNFERLSQNSARGRIVSRYTAQSVKFTYYYSILNICSVTLIIFPNYVKYLISSSYRELVRNGTEPFPHIMYTWMPFDGQKFPLNWVTVAWHVYISYLAMSEEMIFDFTAVIFMLFFGAEFEMLRLRSAELFENCELINEEEFRERVRLLHTLHTRLVKNFRLVNTLLSPVMFAYILLCGLLLCISGIGITVVTSTSQQLRQLEYMLFVLVQVFLYCLFSNEVLVKSSLLAYGPYESEWWRGSRRQRRACVLLAGQMRAECVFSAGPFADLNLATFVAILKGAYSYYTLLRQK